MLSIRALSQSFHPVFAAGSSLREKWWNAVRLRLKHATVLSVQMLYPSACARSQAIAWRKSLGLGRIPHLSSSAHAGERRFSFVPCVSYTSLHFESAMRRISLPLASCFSFLRGFFFWKKGGGDGTQILHEWSSFLLSSRSHWHYNYSLDCSAYCTKCRSQRPVRIRSHGLKQLYSWKFGRENIRNKDEADLASLWGARKTFGEDSKET